MMLLVDSERSGQGSPHYLKFLNQSECLDHIRSLSQEVECSRWGNSQRATGRLLGPRRLPGTASTVRVASLRHKKHQAGIPPVPRGKPPAPAWLLTARCCHSGLVHGVYRLISVWFLISAARVPHGKDYSRICPGRHGSTFGLQSYLLFIGSTFNHISPRSSCHRMFA